MMRRTLRLRSVIVIGAIVAATACAQTAHYVPGSFNIRDFALPDSGFYAGIYNYGYLTDTVKDSSGNPINSVSVTGPGGRVTLTANLNVNVNLYGLAPVFIYVVPKKILGAKYGIMINPNFANASLSGLLSRAEGTGVNASTGQFNIGDTYISPAWLDWSGKHYDAVVNYGFYIPTGKYNIQTVNVPVVGPVRVASPNNTGLGFWENQVQGAVYMYPWEDRRMAIQNAITYESNQTKRGFDVTPGKFITWNWGVSEYLPLKKDQSLLAEIGPSGYGSFQVTDDMGPDARNPGNHETVYAAGLQLGVTIPKRMIVMNFHWFHEFDALNRFQGNAYGLSVVARLGKPK